MATNNHVWQFSRIGGVNRVNLDSGEDLIHLESLDQKLWAALSCPVHGLEIDSKTLELMDIDNDGKIRVPEILESVKWILSLINNADDLTKRSVVFPLTAINTANPLGITLLASARQILKNLGKEGAEELSVEETSDTVRIFAGTRFNGDGIITAESTDEEDLKVLIGQIMSCAGSATDRSGLEGVSADLITQFMQLCEDYTSWHAKAEENSGTILPYGDQTGEAFKLFSELKSKIDDYFLRCRLAEFAPESSDTLNSLSARIEAITDKDISSCLEEIESFPISKIQSPAFLSFDTPLNPVWRDKLNRFFSFIQTKKHGISEDDWKDITNRFGHYAAWVAEKAGEEVESLGVDTLKNILKGDYKNRILALIDQDNALCEEANNIILVDKLVRFYRDIFTVLNNFVSFSDFYAPDKQAIFQVGHLYFDQRCCDLCIRVSDMPKHNTMAKNSGICLVYLDCVSRVKDEKMTIVAAFTDGDVDNLEVGRNAIFYDKNGLDWDATIIKIIENPISIRQAFWSPYRKFSKMISKQLEKLASSQDEKINKTVSENVEKTAAKTDQKLTVVVKTGIPTAPEAPAAAAAEPPKPAPFDIAKFAGIFAAIGLAFGAIGSILASVIGGFLNLVWWKMPLAFLGVILVISGPSMILAWLKLRKRNLAPVLDANGWAVNARATINITFGTTLTHLARLPKNSKLNLKDPFTKKKSPLIPVIIILALAVLAWVLWHYGYFAKWGIL